MDRAAHALAEGGVDHAVAGQRQLAAKGFANDVGLKMHAIVATYGDARAGKPGFDQLAYEVCVHELRFQALAVGDARWAGCAPGRAIQWSSSLIQSVWYRNATSMTAKVTPLVQAGGEDSLLATGMSVVEIEPRALQALRERLDGSFSEACQLILSSRGRVVATGMGKSGHIARKIAATLASTGTPAFYVHPGEASHGDLGMITDADVVLALSNSGETDELLTIIPALKRQGNALIVMSGRPSSTAAHLADVHLDVSVPEEACPLGLAPTSSTTAALVMGDALAVALLEARGFTSEDFARSHPAGDLGRRLLLRIRDVMHAGDDVPRVAADASLTEALVEMSRKRLGMTTIVDADGRLLGVFTDGDLRRALDDARINLRSAAVAELMSRNPRTIAPDQLAVEAAHLMETHQISALVVTDEAQRVLGALNIHDLLRARVV